MQIDSLFPAVTSSGDISTGGVNTGLGQEDFLQLLIAQLENQNPLNPQEATEFTAQLAQFSSLEKLININDALSDLQSIELSLHNAQTASLIGKNIVSLGNELTVSSGKATDIRYDLVQDASIVDISIFDSDSNLVRTIQAGSQAAGRQTIPFDGIDKNGNPLPDGVYTYEVSASTLTGDSISVVSYSSPGKVTGVSYEDGTAVLLVGEQRFPVSYIVEVYE